MSVRGFDRVRKSISKSVKGKHACKFRFTITYEYVDLRCNNKWKPTCLSIVWFRSHRSKVSEKPTSKVSITDDKTGTVSYAANWFPPNSVDLVVTLYKDFTGAFFKKKDYMFVVENVTQDARKKLAIFPCNMAEYATPDTQVFDLEMEFKPLSKKISSARVGAKVKCEFVKQGGSDEDDMQSNFSHLSDADFKQRLSELAECSDDEEEEEEQEENKQSDRDRIADRSKHTWSQFIDEMKTLEYKNVAMLENPIADAPSNGIEPGSDDERTTSPSPEPEETESTQTETTKSSMLLERNRERRKVVSVALETLEDLAECEEEEEDLSIMSPSSFSSPSFTSSLRSKFNFSLSGRKPRSESLPSDPSKEREEFPVESKEKRVTDWLVDVPGDGHTQMRVEQLEKDNINLRTTNSKLVLKVADLEKEKAEAQTELDEMQWLVKFKKSDFVKERDELQAEITELQLLVEDLRTQLQQTEDKLDQSATKKDISSNIEGGKQNAKQTEVCQVRGWLCKRGVKGLTRKKWRRRWFSTDRDGRLYYYQKNNNTMPRGFIDLDVIIAVQDKPVVQQDINKACFNVMTPSRTYELMAHDEEEKLRWINALDYLRHWRNRMASCDGRS